MLADKSKWLFFRSHLPNHRRDVCAHGSWVACGVPTCPTQARKPLGSSLARGRLQAPNITARGVCTMAWVVMRPGHNNDSTATTTIQLSPMYW